MRTEIYIEGQRLDLYNDIQAEFTYSIDDVKDFSSRNTAFSKTIVIPGSANNNKLLGHIFELTSANPYDPTGDNVGTNFNAAVAAECKVYVDNIQIFKGVIRMLEIVMDKRGYEYECAVFGELGGFVSAIGNHKLEDLDFSTYNHVWNITNIQNSWNNTAATGYYYPLIDYGTVSTNKHDYDVKALRPALHVREYIDKIITGSGYTYQSEFFDSNLFKRLIIPQNMRDLMKTSSQPLLATISSSVTMLQSSFNNVKDVPFQTVVVSNMTASVGNTIFTYNGITSSFDITFTGYGNMQSFKAVRIRIYKNTAILSENTQTPAGSFTRPYFVQFNVNVTLTAGEYIKVEYYVDSVANNPYLVTLTSAELKVTGTTTQSSPASYGDAINMNANIPRGIFQRDFFSSILKMFNLYVTEDTNKSKHLIIEPYITFYQPVGDTLMIVDASGNLFAVNNIDNLLLEPGYASQIDWTYKVDRSKPIRIKPMSEINGRYFEFKYKQDSDWYNDQYFKKYSQGYADRIEDTGYEFVNDKQTAEVIFAATPLLGYAGEEKVVPTIFKFQNNIEDRIDHIIRIMQKKKVTGVPSWNITNGATTLLTTTDYPYAGHLDDPDAPIADINFGAPKELFFTVASYPSANLFNGYWSEYVAEISDKDSKLLTCFIRLTQSDIYTLDFKKLILIDGALFRLNKVKDFNTQDVTQVELLRVINTTYI